MTVGYNETQKHKNTKTQKHKNNFNTSFYTST